MTERLPSDHPAVETHRVHLAAVGRTGRVRVPLPAGLDVEAGDVVSLFLDGEPSRAAVDETLAGDRAVGGAFANARLARSGGGTDRLRRWVDEHDLGAGDPAALDVVTEGYAYGLRRPGERVVYEAPDPPADSLRDIARDLDG